MLKKIISVFTTLILSCLIFTFSACSAGDKERMMDKSNTMYVGYVGTSFPISYMPWQSRDGIAPTISSMIYSTLFEYDDILGVFKPLLADSWCYLDLEGNPILTQEGNVDYEKLDEIYGSKNTSTIPVKVVLNKDASWSDGRKVTAEDVYFSFDLCANNSLSNHAGALAWVSDLAHSYSKGKKTINGIYTYNHNQDNKYSFTEEEKDTVIYFNTKKVLGAVTSLFTTILILPEHIWSPIISVDNPINSTNPSDELRYQYENPIGCGPYKLDVKNSNSQEIVLNRRTDYFRKDIEGNDLYKVDKIKFILYQEQNVAIFSLLKGYIDVLDSSINANYRSLFKESEGLKVYEATNPFCLTLVLNMNPTSDNQTELRNYFANKDFRKAIALAIDQPNLISNVQDGAAVEYSNGLVSSDASSMYNDKLYEDEELKDFKLSWDERVTIANEILDKICPNKDSLGYRLSNGKRLSYEILSNPGHQDLISFLQVQLQKIGIEVKYAPSGSTPENTYLYPGKFDMTILSVSFTTTTVDLMMNSHFVTLGKSSNYGRLQDDNLTNKINSMRSTLNQDAKYEELKEIQTLIAKEYYKIPLYSSNVISVARIDRYTNWITASGSTVFNTDCLKVVKRVS